MDYGTSTRFDPERVLDLAELFFGPQGLGLSIIARRTGGLDAAGPQGSVSLRVESSDGSTEVFLSTEALDYQVRQFMVEIYEEAHLHPG